MKKHFVWFVLSLVVITALIAVNRWNVPVTVWLGWVFGIVAFVSGLMCFADVLSR